MNPLSLEQQTILDCIKQQKNVIVDAVAGSGKSTTVLSIAKEMNNTQILQLTYNSSLRTEIKEKTKQLGLSNLKIHTYHSLAVKYYLPTSYTDTGIRYILYNQMPPQIQIPKYSIIVIDEAQDMSLVYFQLVSKFIKDMCDGGDHKIQLLILGDVMQGLYEFKGSDIRFLSLAEKIWKNDPHLFNQDFVKCTMRMSYRITNQMKDFVNDTMLGENRLDACRDGEPVRYIRNSRTNIQKMVIYEINTLLSSGKAKPSDIFVLGASVKGPNSNIRKMENALVNQNIPCHVPMIETDKIDERVIDGKVVFSTFHCVKGRQRKYVFIVGFDNGYMDFYARNLPKDKCPNTLYVGGTRATRGLYVLESDNYSTDRPLEFLKMSHHEMRTSPFIHFKGNPQSIFYKKEEETGDKSKSLLVKHYITPTELIKFIPETVIEDISPIIDKIFVVSQSTNGELEKLEIPNIIQTRQGFFEEISDLNGIAIPSMYYDFLLNDLSEVKNETRETKPRNILYEMIEHNMAGSKENEHVFLQNIIDGLPRTLETISDYLYLANVYVATQEKLYFKLKQIERDEYNWINPDMMSKCTKLLKDTIGVECESSPPTVETTIIHNSMEELHEKIDAFFAQYFENHIKFRFTARVDLITDATVWELKCTSKISLDHLLQVVIYAWLWKMSHEENKKFKILNIKNGELMEMNATLEELNYIMIALIQGKYMEHKPKTDEEFLLETELRV